MGAQWRIELLGGLRVERAERSITPFRRQKAGALVAYLAFYRDHPHPREALIELLWPETDPEDGRNSLRVTLHWLRQQVTELEDGGDSLLIADRSTVRFRPAAFTTDVAEFESALAAAGRASDSGERTRQLSAAVKLYRGELLPGFYETWVLTERQRLAEAHLEALRQLAEALEQAGHLDRALDYARRRVTADPLREEAHFELMRLYAAMGQPAATLRQYQELERLLRDELGETPSPATRALVDELRQNARTIILARGTRLPSVTPPVPPIPSSPAPPTPETPPAVPEHPFATAPGVAALLSPLRLPAQFTRFFGREEEIAQLAAALSIPETRLVTLTGPGGSGKTRLAIAVAGRLQAEFGGSVFFVPLVELTEARRIGDAVRDAMGLPPAADGEALEQVMIALSRQPSLLLLDNFEHLVEDGALVVRQLLERVPTLTCLVTSRQRLDLTAEQEFVVLPLPTPRGSGVQGRQGQPAFGSADPEHLNARTPEHLMRYPSVQLFVDRARAARPEFELTDQNAAPVAELCARLEGLPLAIELAAARSRVLTPSQLLTHLTRRFELLVSHQRDLSPRHRSLRAALESSYQLLSPELQRFFARLSIFPGTWSLEAAAAICGEEGARLRDMPSTAFRWDAGIEHSPPPAAVHDTQALEHLAQLRDLSLVVTQVSAGGTRFGMLETLREFAAERLPPEERSDLERRFFQYFCLWVELLELQRRDPQGDPVDLDKSWLEQHEAEHVNLRAALEWGLTAQPAEALRLATLLATAWYIRGHLTEALEFLPRAARWESDDTWHQRASALRYAGVIAGELGQHERARALLEEVVALGRQRSHTEFIGAALHNLGEVALEEGDYGRARSLFQEALEIRRAPGLERGSATGLAGLGAVAQAEGDPETARAYHEQSLAIYQAVGDARHAAQQLVELGFVACAQRRFAAAQRFFEESLAVFRQYESRTDIGLALLGLGDVALAQEDYAAARTHYAESLHISLETGRRREIAADLEAMARLAQVERQPERAVRLLSAAQTLRETIHSPLPSNQQPAREELLAALRQVLGEEAFSAAWESSRTLPWELVITLALG